MRLLTDGSVMSQYDPTLNRLNSSSIHTSNCPPTVFNTACNDTTREYFTWLRLKFAGYGSIQAIHGIRNLENNPFVFFNRRPWVMEPFQMRPIIFDIATQH